MRLYTKYLEFIYAAPFITHSSNFDVNSSAWNLCCVRIFRLSPRYSINSSHHGLLFSFVSKWGATLLNQIEANERENILQYDTHTFICSNCSPALIRLFSLWFEHVRWILFDWFMIDKSHFYLILFCLVWFCFGNVIRSIYANEKQ